MAKKNFGDLTEREILALAIQLEEEDSRVYGDFAEGLREDYPAPIFAAAFATHKTWDAFLVGLAASLGAGISMAFAEALSDDGSPTGRGRPLFRGFVTGLMTAAGGLGHTLPFLIANFHVAFIAAVVVVAVELAIISYVRHRYMDTPLLASSLQVIVGGALVFAIGILIGSS